MISETAELKLAVSRTLEASQMMLLNTWLQGQE